MSDGSVTAKILRSERDDLESEWLDQLGKAGVRRPELIGEAELRQQCEEVLDLLSNAAEGDLASYDPAQSAEARELLAEISHSRVRLGVSPRENALFILTLKRPLFARLFDHVEDAEELAEETWLASQLVDRLALLVVESYQSSREAVISRQQEELLELSTPVVKLWDGILALPLIGTLDSSRTQVVMETLLERIVDTGADTAILDITGVSTVDTLVAQHLLKTVEAARLMGADCIISGIRPQIAQTIVQLGLDLSSVTTKASLADAFAFALARRGEDVTAIDATDGVGGVEGLSARIPILRIGPFLLATIQVELDDELAVGLLEDLTEAISEHGARGVLIDISSLEIIDSFIGRVLGNVAACSRILDAATVVVGMRPAVAITLVEMGVALRGIRTALDVDQGLELLRDETGRRHQA